MNLQTQVEGQPYEQATVSTHVLPVAEKTCCQHQMSNVVISVTTVLMHSNPALIFITRRTR